jgi:LEA14-like dessication related protein
LQPAPLTGVAQLQGSSALNTAVKRTACLLLLGLMALLAGCTAFRPKIEPLRLMITSAGPTSTDMFSQSFLVRLHVENPNDREIAVTGIDYQLFLQGDSFAEGLTNRPFKLGPKGETEFDMTVRTNFMSSVGRLMSRLGGSRKVEYSIEGTVLTDITMMKKIPFRETGSVELVLPQR